jgi:DUF1009 family protein
VTFPKLGIIAGTGDLPRRVVDACGRTGRPFFVLAFKGQTAPETVEGDDTPHEWVTLGSAGKAIKTLRRNEVRDLVLAGPIDRPSSLSELKPDLWATLFLARVGPSVLNDDDGLLGAFIHELERKEGFHVVDVEAVLAEETAD